METIVLILCKAIAILLDFVSLAMIARMFLPLFGVSEDSKICMFTALITEPFIVPVRFIMVKLNLLQDSPLDWSFTLAYIVLMFVRMMLPVV